MKCNVKCFTIEEWTFGFGFIKFSGCLTDSTYQNLIPLPVFAMMLWNFLYKNNRIRRNKMKKKKKNKVKIYIKKLPNAADYAGRKMLWLYLYISFSEIWPHFLSFKMLIMWNICEALRNYSIECCKNTCFDQIICGRQAKVWNILSWKICIHYYWI